MAWNSARLLKLAGLGVGILGAIALFVMVARVVPVAYGQTVTRSENPLIQWKTSVLGGRSVGLEVRDVDEADVKREKLQASTGVVVENVQADSSAAKAGIKAGDVIVSFDGERVRSAQHFERLVSETPGGRSVDATVLRNGSRVNLKVTVATVDPWAPLRAYSYNWKQPEAWTMTMPRLDGFYYGMAPRSLAGRARLGIGVQNLTEQLGEYFGTSQGALVTAVDEGTPAKAAGLKAGDVIIKINGETVRDEAELRRRLSAAKGETTITVMRERKELTLKAKIED